jgi:TonB family protein
MEAAECDGLRPFCDGQRSRPREHRISLNPGYRGLRAKTIAIAVVLHAIVLVPLVRSGHSRGRAGSDTATQPDIGAFVMAAPQPTATAGIAKAPVAAKATRLQPTLKSRAPKEEAAGTGEPASLIGRHSDVPVRLGAGERLGLIKKVDPIYPALSRTAGVTGIVVLDAVIHRDGTIGDITIVKSSGPAFEKAAMIAVKQWRYTPLPYEGVVTVTIKFIP